jgi:hypothetical protein
MERRSTRSNSKKATVTAATQPLDTQQPAAIISSKVVPLKGDYSSLSDTTVVTMKILRDYVRLALSSK